MKPRTLLLVDDSYYARYIAKKTLSLLNFSTIYEAENGIKAIQSYKMYHPDLVLIDIVMEEMNGLETLKRLIKINPSIKIIMLSAIDVPKILNDCIDRGILDFVVKPYSETQLLTAIKNALETSYK